MPESLLAQRSQPTIFHVDDLKGSDAAKGTSESEAWQSLKKVNEAELIPGDQVLFKRGGLQGWRKVAGKPDTPVRYGNAIEFYDSAADHVVERNRIWEVYDAALTNQGSGENNRQINIIYRDNLIWNSEYTFEFWNRPSSSTTSNIVFEHNTCIDAGYGWGHSQRPDHNNGSHLMFYSNSSRTSDFVVRNNIFVSAMNSCIILVNDWRSGLKMHNNLYWMPNNPLLRWRMHNVQKTITLAEYQKEFDLDQNSLSTEPQFINVAKRDYHLKPGSPGTALAGVAPR